MNVRFALILLLGLAACKTETDATPAPVRMTERAIGHYCQMNLLEHEGPKAQIHLKDVMDPLFFSQVRDAIAYQRLPEQSHEILAIYVNDMGAPGASWADPGATNWIDAQEAVYVVGSRSMGAMGAPELVPYAELADAQKFAADQGGKAVSLSQIPDSEVLAPVGQSDSGGPEGDYNARLRALVPDSGDQP